MKIVASIEARMTSTRLPGKVMMDCVGKPMMHRLIERVKRSQLIETIAISTTTNASDDILEECAKELGIACFRGSEENVVERVVGSMAAHGAEVVVQLTGDCPLLDPQIIDQLIRLYLANSFDYVSNTIVRSYPRGLDCQVVSFETLSKSLEMATDVAQLEHVCLSIYENPEHFSLYNLQAPPELCYPDQRWTLDTPEDYQFLTAIFEALYPSSPTFSSVEVLNYLTKNPEVLHLNREIQQKAVR